MNNADTETEVNTNIFYKANEKLKDSDVENFDVDDSVSELSDNLFNKFDTAILNKNENEFAYNPHILSIFDNIQPSTVGSIANLDIPYENVYPTSNIKTYRLHLSDSSFDISKLKYQLEDIYNNMSDSMPMPMTMGDDTPCNVDSFIDNVSHSQLGGKKKKKNDMLQEITLSLSEEEFPIAMSPTESSISIPLNDLDTDVESSARLKYIMSDIRKKFKKPKKKRKRKRKQKR